MRFRNVLFTLILCCFGIFFLTTTVQAQFFGFSADGAIAYSASDQPISGGSFGITHPIPFVPNLGGMGFFFERRETGPAGYTLATKVSGSAASLFYNIPVPIFSLAIGAGGGTLTTSTDIIGPVGRIETVTASSPLGEGFVRLGLPFFNFLDIHLGYHFVGVSDIKLTEGTTVEVEGVEETVNFTGGMTTIGFQIAL